ncbi:hypothetical protein BDD26_0403 [Xenorhabdus cabanillasii]|uniref:Uncharacterized protein n=1 Tax=Xenorhabdus cabanillasii TaxID=351673 RepID=A0A3D9UD65_9GAMM|nr:hypothetical protein Xcab_00473 [Xenorhabdus cabanillasii JM26]REF25860.1 hypothetical protein BDD26_0403 [Xenorhabdus cabanillasii]
MPSYSAADKAALERQRGLSAVISREGVAMKRISIVADI